MGLGGETIQSGTSSYTPTKDITFKAMYTPITYKVTFKEDDGSVAGELQGTKGQSIFVPAAKPKKDYEFTHWQEEGGTQTIQKGTNYYTVTKTITFKATYTPIIYTIIFLGDNNQEVNRTNASAGTVITVPQAPTLPNYTFTSWIEVGGTERIPSTSSTYTVTRAVTFKAEYNPIIYTVTFFDEDGTTLLATESGAYSTVINVPTPQSKYGYAFSQWKEIGGTATISNTTSYYTITKTISFKAEYVDVIIEIRTQAELNNVRNYPSGKYKLMNDIALTDNGAGYDSSGWLPIGNYPNYFTGTFDGNGHKITGLWIDRPSTSDVGLFGDARGGATIRNLGVEISSRGVKGDSRVGGIVGYLHGSSITNSYSTGSISGIGIGNYIGGIAGSMVSGSSITNSYSTGSVSGSIDVGGIAGSMISGSSITNSYSMGSVGVDGIAIATVGGIAGNVREGSSITNSYSTGSVGSGGSGIGGIAGAIARDGSITNNAAINPSVSGTGSVNRIVGQIGTGGGTISNNFALNTMTVTGATSGNAGTSKSLAQLKSEPTYSDPINGDGNGGLGWKFGNDDANPWKRTIGKNNAYPYLYWDNR
jgi:hypothetical protein